MILASFAYQLIRQLDSVPTAVDRIYQCHLREDTRPDLAGYIEILKHISKTFFKVRLLIDAFDELELVSGYELVGAMESLLAFTNLMITSRPQSIDSQTVEKNSLRCTISAQREDVTVFVRNRLAIGSRGLRKCPGWDAFASDTVEKLVTQAGGMFILVFLQMDMLLRLHTVVEMRRALETISDKVDDFYQITLERIKAGKSDSPLKVLAWVVTSPQPITIGALREALAVEYSTTAIDPDALIAEDDIIPMCCGLVVTSGYIENTGRKLALAHATVHDYLSKYLGLVQGFDRIIAETCVKYINITKFSRQNLRVNNDHDDKYFVEIWENLRQKHPFLTYAAHHLDRNIPQRGELDELQARKIGADFRKAEVEAIVPDARNLLKSGVKFDDLLHGSFPIQGVIPMAKKRPRDSLASDTLGFTCTVRHPNANLFVRGTPCVFIDK